jgi:hypothetical protein
VIAHRRQLLVFVIAAAAVLAGLVAAGLQTIRVRTFSLRVPNLQAVASVRPGHPVCEGPITSTVAARGVALYGTVASGSPTIEVRARSSSSTLASGQLLHVGRSSESDVALDRTIPGGRPVHICVSVGGGVFSLTGAAGQAPGVIAHGLAPGTQFSLALTRPGTFLGSLSTAFSRAAIFRPDWVGAWTFWLLLALLACALPLAGVAVIRALDEPEPDENSRARSGSA